jgi:hypothetical protein
MPIHLNSVEARDIADLDDRQLVGLLRMILAGEARDQIAATHVPSGITVPDDGEDGRWDGGPVPPYIPTPFAVFQVKAKDFGPADCYNEIFVIAPEKKKKGTVAGKKPQAKAVWQEVVKRKGTFIFFCRQDLAHSGHQGKQGISARLDRARAALKECGIRIQPNQVDFLDGNKIAAWANKFVAAITYIYFCLGKLVSRRGRTWLEWKRDESNRVDYCGSRRSAEPPVFAFGRCGGARLSPAAGGLATLGQERNFRLLEGSRRALSLDCFEQGD